MKLANVIGLGKIPGIHARLFALDTSSPRQIKFQVVGTEPDSGLEMIEEKDENATWERQNVFLEDYTDGHGRTGTMTFIRYTSANAEPNECVDRLKMISVTRIIFKVTQVIGGDAVKYQGTFDVKITRYCECLPDEGATIVSMESARTDIGGPVYLNKISNSTPGEQAADSTYPSGETNKSTIEVNTGNYQVRIKGATNGPWVNLPPPGFTIHCC